MASLVPRAILGLCAALTMHVAAAHAEDSCPEPERQDATKKLMKMVEEDPELRRDLKESIALGQQINDDPQTNPVDDLAAYYDFVDALITYNPRNIQTGHMSDGMSVSMDGDNYCNWNILDLLAYSHFLVDRQLTTGPRGQIQFKNEEFGAWMRQLADAWGDYLETPDSAKYVPEFEDDPTFGDWYCPPSDGYDSFQDFFTRELCPKQFPYGSRPVEGYDDPRTVVSVGDSKSAGWWPISQEGKLVTGYEQVSQSGRMIKGKLYNDIGNFIEGGPGEKVVEQFGDIDPARFNGGTFTHQFLNVNNYHRLHTPVAGEVVFMRHIKAGVRMKSGWSNPPDGPAHYAPLDTPDWQFGQTRLVLGIETDDHGLVIAAPMGMAQVAAIPMRSWVEKGVEAKKGWEFANFAFGGSDFVVLFEDKADFRLAVPKTDRDGPGVAYKPSKQGEKYGCFGGTTDCGDAAGNPPPIPSASD